MTKYEMRDIVKLMRNSAMMLEIADIGTPRFNELNCKQAELLRAVADYLEEAKVEAA